MSRIQSTCLNAQMCKASLIIIVNDVDDGSIIDMEREVLVWVKDKDIEWIGSEISRRRSETIKA